MKKIAEIEKAVKNETQEELNISHTFYWAYWTARERKNQHLDFNDVIWSKDVDAIFADLKRYGIKTFTISDKSTGLMGTLAEFCERGCKVTGMVKINGFKKILDDGFEQNNAIKLQMPR